MPSHGLGILRTKTRATGPRRWEDRGEKRFPHLSYCQSLCAELSPRFFRERNRDSPPPPTPPLEDFRKLPALLIGCALPAQGRAVCRPAPVGAGRAVSAVFPALLTYCLFGAAGLGLHTQFLCLHSSAECASLKEAERSSVFSWPAPAGCPAGPGQHAQASPRDCPSLSPQPVLTWAVLGGGGGCWPPWQVATPVLKAAEPPAAGRTLQACIPAGVCLSFLETGTCDAKAWPASPRGLWKF